MIQHRYKSIWAKGFAQYFWTKVDVKGPFECWPWKGHVKKDGYGQIKVNGKMLSASRLAITLHLGCDIGDKLACHHCDNPRCCNPSHIYPGTYKDNSRDVDERKRRNPPTGEAHPNSKLTTDKVVQIRSLRMAGVKTTEIASLFGVEETTVRDVSSGRSWRSVPLTSLPEPRT